jgi:hypothetical protein
MSSDLYDIPLKSIDGKPVSLASHRGKVLLVVNVASRCGLTPQYEGLERLYEKYRDRGLEVLGFPANEFGAQEPGTDEEIKSFCDTKYDVKFPMSSKIVVRGKTPLRGPGANQGRSRVMRPRLPLRKSWMRMSDALWRSTAPPARKHPRRRPIATRSAAASAGIVASL